jgi:hypothetical protein
MPEELGRAQSNPGKRGGSQGARRQNARSSQSNLAPTDAGAHNEDRKHGEDSRTGLQVKSGARKQNVKQSYPTLTLPPKEKPIKGSRSITLSKSHRGKVSTAESVSSKARADDPGSTQKR